jgi:nuclear transport factor 2 (NTF2) superfamily protein
MTIENRPRLATLLFEELWNFREAALQRELAYAEHDDARNWHH